MSEQLEARLEALDKRLQVARSGERWSTVAEMQAERQVVAEQLQAAQHAARQATADTARQQQAQTVADLQAQGVALQGKWLAWQQALDATERQARTLWAQYDELTSNGAQLKAAYGRVAPGQTLDVGLNALTTPAARAVHAERGALKWRPRLAPLDA